LRGYVEMERGGHDLVIAPDYMAHGMRMRASELATEWLGPRTELEIRQSLLREVEQERLTSLDRALLRQATLDIVDLTEKPSDRQYQNVLRSRLQALEGMTLAERIDANHWRLGEGIEATLAARGERGDILRTMHKALKGQQRECLIGTDEAVSVVGRIAAKGLADELNDRGCLVVDGIDGRAHYLKLPVGTDLSELPIGGIVHAKPAGQERAMDRNISNLAQGGIYRTVDHLERLRQDGAKGPQSTVDVTVRRLEALRRVGIAERMTDGVWRVPGDFLERAKTFDLQKSAGVAIELRSHLPLDQQVRAIGATWLDRKLVGVDEGLARQGFGAQVRVAMAERVDFLVEQGLAERQGQRVTYARNLVGTLRDRELANAGKAIQDQTGLRYRPLKDGESSSGIYRRSVQLASGRFAMLDDGMRFSLVPWRPVVEQRLGQQVSALCRGETVSMQWGRQRGVSL
jgi:hypothetical protein